MTDPAAEFLYSAPRSERAFDDPVDCYEAEFDGDDDRTPRTIEKWTAATPARDLPSVEHTIEWVVEHATNDVSPGGPVVYGRGVEVSGATAPETCWRRIQRM